MQMRFALVVGVMLSACASPPVQKPMKGGPVDIGAGSLEAVRRQLEGTWTLTSYEVYRDGKRQRVPASAHLSYDNFGNLTMTGELARPGAGETRPVLLNYSGRAVLDVATRELRLLGMVQSGDAVPSSVVEATSPENVRHYDIRGDVLTLTVLSGKGKPTAASAWKKQP